MRLRPSLNMMPRSPSACQESTGMNRGTTGMNRCSTGMTLDDRGQPGLHRKVLKCLLPPDEARVHRVGPVTTGVAPGTTGTVPGTTGTGTLAPPGPNTARQSFGNAPVEPR
ncbi:hypothetical protein DPMN_139549 [Dreissena polymorpha]|uniref:Uncharacterized protein n=1 Tax=Dreissena polymorpha TaxID=45954 RepID=A0A9D4JJJ7_DREPO|nr:hypothetical protein DPMN_139549 [Dreissena polymorpha]